MITVNRDKLYVINQCDKFYKNIEIKFKINNFLYKKKLNLRRYRVTLKIFFN